MNGTQWLLLVGSLALLLVVFIKLNPPKPVYRTKQEVADIIEQFLDNAGGQWDWDDFTSFRIADPELDAIRNRCGELFETGYPGQWCGPEGKGEMRRMVEQLRQREKGG